MTCRRQSSFICRGGTGLYMKRGFSCFAVRGGVPFRTHLLLRAVWNWIFFCQEMPDNRHYVNQLACSYPLVHRLAITINDR